MFDRDADDELDRWYGPPPPRPRLRAVPPPPVDAGRAAKEVLVLRETLRWTLSHGRAYPDLQSRTEALDLWRDARRAELGLPPEPVEHWEPRQPDRRGSVRT